MRQVETWVLGAGMVVLLASAAAAGLCEKCKGKAYIQNIGKCRACDGHTSSGAFALCGKCSGKVGLCQHCLAPLDPKSIVLGDEANGKSIEAEVGKFVYVRLAGNPTTGYSWALKKLEGEALDQAAKLLYIPRKVPRGMVGSGGTFLAAFRAAKPGKATVTLAYARPWEKDKPPEKTFTVTIEVKKPEEK